MIAFGREESYPWLRPPSHPSVLILGFLLCLVPPGIPYSASVYGVNGSCPSGLKAVCLAASSVALGETPLALAVGVESLSNAPYLLLYERLFPSADTVALAAATVAAAF